jgi:hypothetical protein
MKRMNSLSIIFTILILLPRIKVLMNWFNDSPRMLMILIINIMMRWILM